MPKLKTRKENAFSSEPGFGAKIPAGAIPKSYTLKSLQFESGEQAENEPTLADKLQVSKTRSEEEYARNKAFLEEEEERKISQAKMREEAYQRSLGDSTPTEDSPKKKRMEYYKKTGGVKIGEFTEEEFQEYLDEIGERPLNKSVDSNTGETTTEMTWDDINRIRTTDFKLYEKMIKEGRIDVKKVRR